MNWLDVNCHLNGNSIIYSNKQLELETIVNALSVITALRLKPTDKQMLEQSKKIYDIISAAKKSKDRTISNELLKSFKLVGLEKEVDDILCEWREQKLGLD